ncbi:hypothetical protein N1851_023342 [Merluccius polli]|uniref:DUF6729 domain-containing protein n=1 Tax=Merluccius polli TaxID=89951 RepID=A0AA47MG87_MERPO|nr:hypothetical protein N1851_023342 [Merluccius polli]
MALHCRRTTSERVIEMEGTHHPSFWRPTTGTGGGNTLGVPLIHSERMAEIWKAQTKTLCCLQDPPWRASVHADRAPCRWGGAHLCKPTDAPGGQHLWRVFHLHMKPCDPSSRAYLVDGLARRNEGQGHGAEGRVAPHSYSGLLRHAVNQLAEEVLRRKLLDYTPPRKYTGAQTFCLKNLICISINCIYMYIMCVSVCWFYVLVIFSQTGCALEDYKRTLTAMETEEVSVAEDEGYVEPEAEDIEDFTQRPAAPRLPAASCSTRLPAAEQNLSPCCWKPALPVLDQQWISKALFQWSKTGQPELTSPGGQCGGTPATITGAYRHSANGAYFGHPLFLWMPRKLWRVRLLCPHEDCGRRTDSADCTREYDSGWCQHDLLHGVRVSVLQGVQAKVISWTRNIIRQLDIAIKSIPRPPDLQAGCDIRSCGRCVRGVWATAAASCKDRWLSTPEVWLQKQLQFLTDCSGFARAVSAGLVAPMAIGDTPKMMEVPKHRWLMQVYSQDVLGRLEEIKASITSLFGRVLKLDSTKKIVKKLAVRAASQHRGPPTLAMRRAVIMSVLTASEGYGLGPMIGGLESRYKTLACLLPRCCMSTDCCGSTHLHKIFGSWDRMLLRLDIWHFMRRIAIDSHSLYAGFMNQLSQCIFIWDEDDVRALTEAKRAELAPRHILPPTPADVMRRISRAEMALHCRRTTRSRDEMEALITQLLEAYDGDRVSGCEIWKAQTKHLCCLQDPPGVQLYMQTAPCRRGGTLCQPTDAPGGQHLWRFPSPHEPSSQAYLVDGLARWNEDRPWQQRRVAPTPTAAFYDMLSTTCGGGPTTEAVGLHAATEIHWCATFCLKNHMYSINCIYMYIMCVSPVPSTHRTTHQPVPSTHCTTHQPVPSAHRTTHQPVPSAHRTTHHRSPAPTASWSQAPTAPPTSRSPAPTASWSQAPTAPPTSRSPAPTASWSPAQAVPTLHPLQTSVGPDNIPGYAAVQELARCLVGLKEHIVALTQEEANSIISLWQALSEFDKGRTTYPPRHRATLSTGRFRTTKKIVAPGWSPPDGMFI